VLDDYRLLMTQIVILAAVLDPVGHLSLFLGATTTLDRTARQRAAWLSVVIAFGILTGFGLLGHFLLHAMGISLLSFQIAGGLIVLLFAIRMVLGEGEQASLHADQDASAASIAIYPLATPIIAGPGAMLTILLLVDNNRHTPGEQALTILALALVLTLLLIVFTLGDMVRHLIGQHGTGLVRRIMGLLLAALAVNMVLSAIALWLHLPEI
jgi:multiple antibiotic resistance protein